MKKPLMLAVFALSLILASALVINSTIANITSRTWLGSTFSWGTDGYYGTTVYGYQQNSEATVWVGVNNNFGRPINVSRIIVGFDWNINYTNALATPTRMGTGETRYFTVTFTVPNTTIASNAFLHGYTIYVQHVNATGALVATMSTGTTYTTNPDFAVYSTDQWDAREAARLNSQLGEPEEGFNSTSARILWAKAANETTVANTFYALGDFSDAKTHYDTALSLKNQAFTVEQTLTGGIQDAELSLLLGQAHSFEAQANFFNGLYYMWVLIGIALVLFAIGYIIRGFSSYRKPAIST